MFILYFLSNQEMTSRSIFVCRIVFVEMRVWYDTINIIGLRIVATTCSYLASLDATMTQCKYIIKSILLAALTYTPCCAFTVPSLQQAHAKDGVLADYNSGPWTTAKHSLRKPDCCVVSVTSLDKELTVLQRYFCSPDAPTDLDLRAKVRCGDSSTSYHDCFKIYKSIMEPSQLKDRVNDVGEDFDFDIDHNNPCILALEAIAKGVASLADGPLEGTVKDVHVRVVFASNYEAKDPMFHTDKCPLRGYVTLTGPGTQYMDRVCFPWEYISLRTLGTEDATNVEGLTMAEELEFIVMKGDKYVAPASTDSKPSISQILLEKTWTRRAACVHRSPPASDSRSKRRVILSLDLADGDDNQEWYQYNQKRGWRSGMTQRKSRLVA
jgi:hypothetical protein